MFKPSELEKIVHSCWRHFWFVITWCWYFTLLFHMYPHLLCSFCPLLFDWVIHPFRIFSSNVKFVKYLDISSWILWKLCLKIFSFIQLLNDCKKQTIVINVFSSKTMNIMWCNLKATQMMCHLRSSSEKCPYDPFFCLYGQSSPYTSFAPKSGSHIHPHWTSYQLINLIDISL